ncbi:MAG: molybdopterin-guanine dinucleotide biosynthesis protein MobB [Eubacterium sp.]|nr:molybdopterin-guanine dinucleotide biosynthesis protein MobB [Eubacterium sp.]
MKRSIIGLTGWSGSGKTTLLEKLIPSLKEIARQSGRVDYQIVVIKHDAHGLKLRPLASTEDRSGQTKRPEERILRTRNASARNDTDLYEDEPGKDSWRFRQAGADQVILCGPEGIYVSAKPFPSNVPTVREYKTNRWEREHVFCLKQVPCTEKGNLETALQLAAGADLIFIEGFKGEVYPRIGVMRKETGKGLPDSAEDYLAIAADDRDYAANTSLFRLDDVFGIAQFIWKYQQET